MRAPPPERPLPVSPGEADRLLREPLLGPTQGCLLRELLKAERQDNRHGVRRVARQRLLHGVPGLWREHCVPWETLRHFNKGFACEWIGQWHVLVGTKSNELVCVDVRTLETTLVANAPEPPRAPAPEGALPYPREQKNCGHHAITFNPSTQLVATGGTNPADAQVFTVLQGRDGRPAFQAARTLVGHVDWIFGLAWLTDVHLVSGGRDRTLRLWQVNQQGDPCVTGPLTTVVASEQHKVREVCYSPDVCAVHALLTGGTVQLWDPHLHPVRQFPLSVDKEVVSMAARGHLVAVGSMQHVTLLDSRVPSRACALLTTNEGVRSLELQGNLLSVGSGGGHLSFLDLRTGAFLPLPDTRPGASWGPQEAAPRALRVDRGYVCTTDQVFREHFQGVEVPPALMAHKWDPLGTRLFAAGGPLSVGLQGCYLACFA